MNHPSTGRRIGARFLDAGYGVGFLVLWIAVGAAVRGGLGFLLAGYLLVALAQFAVQLRYSATLGQLTLGIHNVRIEDGRPSGGRTVLKYLLMGLLGQVSCGIALVVAIVVMQPPENRSWFDKWTGLVVVRREPVVAPAAGATSAPIVSAPPVEASAPSWARPPQPEEGHTQLAPAAPPAAVAPTVVVPGPGSLYLDNGQVLRLDRGYVLGRDPVPPASHPDAAAVSISDAARSISKTHVLLAPAPNGAVVVDLHSTNGVTVTVPQGERRLTPAQPVTVPYGAVVRYGERSVEVRR